MERITAYADMVEIIIISGLTNFYAKKKFSHNKIVSQMHRKTEHFFYTDELIQKKKQTMINIINETKLTSLISNPLLLLEP